MLSFTGREVVCLEQEGKKKTSELLRSDGWPRKKLQEKKKSGERKNTKGKKKLAVVCLCVCVCVYVCMCMCVWVSWVRLHKRSMCFKLTNSLMSLEKHVKCCHCSNERCLRGEKHMQRSAYWLKTLLCPQIAWDCDGPGWDAIHIRLSLPPLSLMPVMLIFLGCCKCFFLSCVYLCLCVSVSLSVRENCNLGFPEWLSHSCGSNVFRQNPLFQLFAMQFKPKGHLRNALQNFCVQCSVLWVFSWLLCNSQHSQMSKCLHTFKGGIRHFSD